MVEMPVRSMVRPLLTFIAPLSEAVAPGQELAARGRAHGGDVEVGQADGLGVQAVEVRRLEDRIAVAREVAVALVVGHDDDDVGAVGRCRVPALSVRVPG